jgi:hypothetical protein
MDKEDPRIVVGFFPVLFGEGEMMKGLGAQ